MPNPQKLPRYRGNNTTQIGTAAWSEVKAQFLTLYRLTGTREAATELCDEFITWPLGPGQVRVKADPHILEGWIQQYDDGKYSPPNPLIVERFEERWNNAFKDAYRKLGFEGVKTTLQLLRQSREGNLTRAIDLEYAKNSAWAGAEGYEKIAGPAPTHIQQRVVGGVRIITPLTRKKKKKLVSKQQKQLAPVNAEFTVIE